VHRQRPAVACPQLLQLLTPPLAQRLVAEAGHGPVEKQLDSLQERHLQFPPSCQFEEHLPVGQKTWTFKNGFALPRQLPILLPSLVRQYHQRANEGFDRRDERVQRQQRAIIEFFQQWVRQR